MALQEAFGQQKVVSQLPHGLDADKDKFFKRSRQGDMFFATDTKKFYIAQNTSGAEDTLALAINPHETGQ